MLLICFSCEFLLFYGNKGLNIQIFLSKLINAIEIKMITQGPKILHQIDV